MKIAMPVEGRIIDASVLGAAFFEEVGTPLARGFVRSTTDLMAPSLLLFEIASVAAKKTWKGLARAEVGERAVNETRRLVDLVEPTADLIRSAYGLACHHRISVYDASYVSLAQAKGLTVVTLDAKLVMRVRESGLGNLVCLLDDES